MGPDERDKYQSRDFRLHRKYILVLAVVQFIVTYGGIEFDRINFMGLVGEIKNPEIFQISILILTGYSLIRYYQYFDTDCLGYLMANYRSILNSKFARYASKKFTNELIKDDVINPGETLVESPFNINQFKKNANGDYVLFNVTLRNIKKSETKTINVKEKKVGKNRFRFLQLTSGFEYVIRRPYFFELIFPILIALVSIGLGLNDVFRLNDN
jgi:hypothetical protein